LRYKKIALALCYKKHINVFQKTASRQKKEKREHEKEGMGEGKKKKEGEIGQLLARNIVFFEVSTINRV